MSFDYNVLTIDPNTQQVIGACDHHQSFERYVIDFNDFRTLHYASNTAQNMRAPINGQAIVQIWISGEEIQSDDPNYGWTIQLDADPPGQIVQSTYPFYKIVFDKPVRLVFPLIEVSYITAQPYCLKCSGLGVLNDFKPVSSGSFLRIIQQAKLAQKGLKWLLSSQNPFYPNFVCTLKNYVGQKYGISITDTDIQNSIQNALTLLQQVQQAQATIPSQNLDPLETLKDIQSITVTPDPNDPTTISVAVIITTFSGTSVPLSFQMTVNND